MPIPLQLRVFHPGSQPVSIYVPDPGAVEADYRQRRSADPNVPFPFWTQVWPAALALSQFIAEHPELVTGKRILELGAGLGLPSFTAAAWAESVCCSDYLPEAVEVLQQSAGQPGYAHVACRLIDWHALSPDLTADVLLMSDINYDPAAFEVLFGVLRSFLGKGVRILLSTPQRLMGKPFIERLLPWCTEQQEVAVPHGTETVQTSVLVLEEKNLESGYAISPVN